LIFTGLIQFLLKLFLFTLMCIILWRIIVYELGFYLQLFFYGLALVKRTLVYFRVVVLILALIYIRFIIIVRILFPQTTLLIIQVLMLLILLFSVLILSLSADFDVLEVLITLLNQIMYLIQLLDLYFLVHSDIFWLKLHVIVLLMQLV